jgi:hypothetical protein
VPADRKIPEAIADHEANSRSEPRALREQAEQEWSGAKQHFGDSLLK